MSTSATANRVYARERITANDILAMGPDELLLRGCKPPAKVGGIFTPSAGAEGEAPTEVKDHPLRACAFFEVVAMPVELTRGNPLGIDVGDILLCRNVLVDPLLGNELGITNFYMGVVGVAERAGPVVH